MRKFSAKALLGPRAVADGDWISHGVGQDELARAFNLPPAVAEILLAGLIATGTVRALSADGPVDLDECVIADLAGKAKRVAAGEFREWVRDNSVLPLGAGLRDRFIAQALREGLDPPRLIQWKAFCDHIRKGCNGWVGNGAKRRAAWGFSDKQIQRAVKGLRGG
jgi:hypothetical protein